MKKVRFLSTTMEDLDCHSPRPFIAKELNSYTPEKQLAFPARTWVDTDPVTLFETSNSIPYPIISKSEINKSDWGYKENMNIQPSDQLNLSFLDSSYIEPRKPIIAKSAAFQPLMKSASLDSDYRESVEPLRTAFKPIENQGHKNTQNIRDNSFFIRRDNIDKVLPLATANINKDFARLNMGNDNDVIAKKAEIMQNPVPVLLANNMNLDQRNKVVFPEESCKCYYCNTLPQKNANAVYQHEAKQSPIAQYSYPVIQNSQNQFNCRQHCHSNCAVNIPPAPPACHCKSPECRPKNSIENKTRAIEKYEQSLQPESNDIEKAMAVKKKREPTVTDLFKIIKLQNEQLQLLQDKVDRFISAANNPKPMLPVQNYVSEKLTVETVENDHKISIGVMTSFEIRTSIYNKEVVKAQNNQVSRPQVQQDSQTTQQKVVNFLDGIPPVQSPQTKEVDVSNSLYESDISNDKSPNKEEKTLNELSLYNVQVDNATTPLLSPEQTLYLDVRDYSDSDSTSDDQSNVGWTYYNKVMTHVNGMLHDSEMPSSASALYRGARQQCLQMQIDRTNVSVMKRVKFGDEPLPYTPTLQAATDTSMKMNQLAAKYLKNGAQTRRAPNINTDMSFATRKYMERHQLLHGGMPTQPLPTQAPAELPRFLDITALKQQPKFL